MKRMLFIPIILALAVSACASPVLNTPNPDASNAGVNDVDGSNMANDVNNTDTSASPDAVDTDTSNADAAPEAMSAPTCYPDGQHPIAVSIAEQYTQIASYDKVMSWFCSGALFDDILNALVTEEMSGVGAEELLQRLAAGTSWNQIWLELGITEE